jgi:DNA-binding transcriptional LysR family regulator
MTRRAEFDKIEVFLIRVLQTLITERSVSRAAMRLHSTQPAVSAQLKRLRALTGDPLLVRSGNGMVPTETALQLLAPAARMLQDADRLFGAHASQRGFEPLTSTAVFRIAASDYLDPLFLPELVAQVKKLAPQVRLELLPLSASSTTGAAWRAARSTGGRQLARAARRAAPRQADVGRDRLPGRRDHPAVRSSAAGSARSAASGAARNGAARGWTVERYLACEHVAPTPLHANAPGVIDEHLATLGLTRDVMVRSAHFSLIPLMVAQSLLVLTTGRLFCSRYVDALPVRIVRCPVAFPPLTTTSSGTT